MNMLMGIIVYLIHGLLFGYAARRVSEYRGEPDGFWWGFWLGWIGLLVVIFRNQTTQEISTSLPGSTMRQSWLCCRCGARNPSGKDQCQSCGTPKETFISTRICASCGAKNKAANQKCFACGHSFEN